MKRINRTPAEIEELLRSLEGIERATPRPFFATRTEARLEARLAQRQASPLPRSWAVRPLPLVVMMGLILALNLSAVVLYRWQLTTAEDSSMNADPFTIDWQLNDPFLW